MLNILSSIGSFLAAAVAVFVLLVLLLTPVLSPPVASAAPVPFSRSQCRAGPVTKATNQNSRHRPFMNRNNGRRHS